ncbi:alpha-adducin-like isoform X2 [Patiria miniata]|uniref:Class II aldolase/adducin N-terminal domain-containing protein n=1 Tax=Patiria miniata TaxID=46514 RepID=A0A914B509_PATMI|nr:alpha-adducin-like isoform X2 [Patiria miniata]
MADTLANNVDEREKLIPDLDDPEFQKELQRPAHIKADMRDMERQRRVSLILNSQAFREELESIIESQLKDMFQSGPHPASLIALQQIADLVLPQSRFNQTSVGGGRGGGAAQGASLIPVADIRGVDSVNYSKGEKILRCKLAALYRLIDLHGWTQLIYNHVSLRVSMETDHFLINPFGMMYHEVTASSLIKVDMLGQTVDPGTTTFGPNLAGFTLHSAIHSCRPDAKCVVHIHTPGVVAVSSMKQGLLPLSQEALICGEVSYLDYSGIIVNDQQKDDIIRALGPNSKILFLRNHGVVCCGETVEEAYYWTYNVVAACEIQVRCMSVGLDNLILVSDAVKEETREVAVKGGGGVIKPTSPEEEGEKRRERRWKIGELEFEAMMRQLDNMGHRTGFVYHQPLVRSDPKPRSEVAHPAASTSVTYFYDDDREGSKYQSPMKLMNRKQAGEKTKWLNTPNTYTKVEVQEEVKEGEEAKTKTVWVTDEAKQTSGESMKVAPHQFSVLSEDPKELKKKQKGMKADRFDDKVTAGPISEVLSGVQYGDSRRAQLARDAPLSDSKDKLQDSPRKPGADGDQVQAASKGIIKREHQKDVMLYTAYAPNPFENMTEEDILKYKQEIAEKTGQDVKEIELIVQAPNMNGPDGMEETTTTTQREVVVTKGEDGSEVTTTRVVTTKMTTKETTLNGDEAEAEAEEGEEDDERAASPSQEAGVRSASSAEASPTKDATSPSKKKDKGKKKFRTPSFLKSKKDKKEKAES